MPIIAEIWLNEIYKDKIDKILKHTAIPDAASCNDMKCNDPKHIQDIDSYTEELVKVLNDAKGHFPVKNNQKIKNKDNK